MHRIWKDKNYFYDRAKNRRYYFKQIVYLFVVNSDRNGMRRMVLIVKHCLINNTVKGVSA